MNSKTLQLLSIQLDIVRKSQRAFLSKANSKTPAEISTRDHKLCLCKVVMTLEFQTQQRHNTIYFIYIQRGSAEVGLVVLCF